MHLGRGLGRTDADAIGVSVVLTHRAWARLCGGDPSAIVR
jgi:hypothetical protein